MSRYNPFEERRKNERINRLVKENTELKAKVEKLEQDYDSKRLHADLMEQAVKVAQSQTQELIEQNREIVEMLEDMETAWQSLPYGHNSVRDTQNWISNIIHPQILRMREWVSKHKTKHNHLKSNTNETDKI